MYNEIFESMGEGYGEAVFQIRKERAVEETLARLGGDMDLMYESHWSGSDDRYDDEYYPAGSAWKNTTLREVLEDMAEYDHTDCYKDSDGKTRWRRERRVFDFDGIESLNDVSEMFQESLCGDDHGVGPLLTPAVVEKERLDRRRKCLEQTAAQFAAQCGYKVGTREYVLAAYRAIDKVRYERERWNDGETRMEQWAACRYAGVGSDVYYDDLNFENSRYAGRLDRLGEVLDWLEEVCPLLMRQIEQERVAAGDVEDDSDDEYNFG
jgi:hypothetical protein